MPAWEGGWWRGAWRGRGGRGQDCGLAGGAAGRAVLRAGWSGGSAGLCQGCLGLQVGRTGAVWMTVVCTWCCGGWCGGVPGVGAGSGWWVSAKKRVINALVCGSCRGVDLLKHAVEVLGLGRVIGGEWGVVGVYDLRFGFMAGGSAAGAVSIVHRLRERFLSGNGE